MEGNVKSGPQRRERVVESERLLRGIPVSRAGFRKKGPSDQISQATSLLPRANAERSAPSEPGVSTSIST